MINFQTSTRSTNTWAPRAPATRTAIAHVLSSVAVALLFAASTPDAASAQRRKAAQSSTNRTLQPQRRATPQATGTTPGIRRIRRPKAGQGGNHPLKVKHGVAGLTIADFGSIKSNKGGEITAAVVPPGAKPQCPAGRLLISMDKVKDPEGGQILGRNLDNLAGSTISANLTGYVQNASVENQTVEVRHIRSNDQELAVLPNGDVLYMRMGRSRAELPGGRPPWFEHAYKISSDAPWGPGARSELLIFRSSDCGTNFSLVSTIDTATILDGIAGLPAGAGGLPQKCASCPLTLPNGRRAYQMGGTDGPLLKVDPATGFVYMSIKIVGYQPTPSAGGQTFALSDSRINKTVITRSKNGGTSWQVAAVLDYGAWRHEMTPRGANTLLLAHGDIVVEQPVLDQRPSSVGPAHTRAFAVPGSAVGWEGPPNSAVSGLRRQTISAGLADPGAQLLMMADTHNRTESGKHGWRAFAFDWNRPSNGFVEYQPPIMPRTDGHADFIFNPVVVDLGVGPTFAYWYDIEHRGNTQYLTVRGRLFLDKQSQTVDFTIRTPFDVTRCVPATGCQSTFYGHYQMAGGYYRVEPSGTRRSVFYPVWLEPGGVIRFARVEYQTGRPRPSQANPAGRGIRTTKRKRGLRGVRANPANVKLDWLDEHQEEETRLQSTTTGR